MPKGMQAIYTQTLASNSAALSFQNIPQNYTDLLIKISMRYTSANTSYDLIASFDTQASVYSSTAFGSYSQRQSNAGYILCGNAAAASATANTFSNTDFYISGYSSNNFKTIAVDAVAENNAAGTAVYLNACLYRSSAPISKVYFGTAGGGDFVAGTTVTIYGISRQ
jgi:hypothetical protein